MVEQLPYCDLLRLSPFDWMICLVSLTSRPMQRALKKRQSFALLRAELCLFLLAKFFRNNFKCESCLWSTVEAWCRPAGSLGVRKITTGMSHQLTVGVTLSAAAAKSPSQFCNGSLRNTQVLLATVVPTWVKPLVFGVLQQLAKCQQFEFCS